MSVTYAWNNNISYVFYGNIVHLRYIKDKEGKGGGSSLICAKQMSLYIQCH